MGCPCSRLASSPELVPVVPTGFQATTKDAGSESGECPEIVVDECLALLGNLFSWGRGSVGVLVPS